MKKEHTFEDTVAEVKAIGDAYREEQAVEDMKRRELNSERIEELSEDWHKTNNFLKEKINELVRVINSQNKRIIELEIKCH